MPTEVVRAGIGGIDLAAAVGGLRQTGFKPSDVAGPSVFTGQGRRGSDGRHVAAPPLGQQRTAHLAPPQPSVEYVEEGQEEEVVVRAGTSEFLGARSGLNKTGLSDRLRETPQPPPPPPPQQQQQQQQQQAPMVAAAAAPSAPGVGQWQGLPQQGQQQQASGSQPASWQTRQGMLKSTGLMGSSGGGGAAQQASSGQGREESAAPSAPWQQGAAGLRRTGL